MEKAQENQSNAKRISAGSFSVWLKHIKTSFKGYSGMSVPCGNCRGCCRSSLFIQVGGDEAETISKIGIKRLVKAPGKIEGELILGYLKNGYCPMMVDKKCSIYEERPKTCRTYDCRIFAAAGIVPYSKENEITRRVRKWQFHYSNTRDRLKHKAIIKAADFIKNEAKYFPHEKAPSEPGQLAITAIKVFDVFLDKNAFMSSKVKKETAQEIVRRVYKDYYKLKRVIREIPNNERKTV